MPHEKGRPQQSGPSPTVDQTETTIPPTADEWRDRLAERVAATMARRGAQKAVRAMLADRRAHGLRARHAAKQRRSGGA